MSTQPSPFNPSRQVERIREVLVGRQMARLEQRVDRLERTVPESRPPTSAAAPPVELQRVDLRLDQFRANVQAQAQVLAGEIGRIEHRLAEVETKALTPPLPPAAPFDPRVDQLETLVGQQGRALTAQIAAETKQRRDETTALAARIQQSVDAFGKRLATLQTPPVERQLGALRDEVLAETSALRRKVEGEVMRRAEDLREMTARIEQVAQRLESSPASASSVRALELRLSTWLQQWQDQLARYLQGREQQLIGHLRDELQRMRDSTARALADLHARKADRTEMHDRLARVSAIAHALAEADNQPQGS